MAGGVALNCVANGRLLREGPFKDLWVQPAAGDAGGSIGAALLAWHRLEERPRNGQASSDRMRGAYLGPAFSNERRRRGRYPWRAACGHLVWTCQGSELRAGPGLGPTGRSRINRSGQSLPAKHRFSGLPEFYSWRRSCVALFHC